MIEASAFRAAFPSVEQGVHLDHAGVAPISRPVAEAIERFTREALVRPWSRYPYWEARVEAVREACARLAGARVHQVAFVKNTSEALSFVAGGLDWRAGDVVVVVDEEFPSNVYPWWDLRRLGVEVRTLRAEDVVGDLQKFAAALDDRVKLVAVSAIAYATGDRRPLGALAEACRRHGALLVVDAIQALGVVEMDLDGEGLDCVAADGHKWICAPEGAGFLAVSERLLDRLRPTELGWKSVAKRGQYYPYAFELRRDAAKLEAGSLNLLALHALGAAVELALSAGVAEIERRVVALTEALAEGIRARGLRLLGSRGSGSGSAASGILTFVPDCDPERLRQDLWARGVVCKVRLGGLRLAPHHYQDGREVATFFDKLDDARRSAS